MSKCNSKIIISILLSSMLLTACDPGDVVPDEATLSTTCPSGGAIEDCTVTATVKWVKSGIVDLNEVSVSDFGLNMSESNVSFSSNSGSILLTVKNGNSIVATKLFSWFRSGNGIFASDPVAMQSWVTSKFELGDTLTYGFDDIEFSPHLGTNTVTMVIEYMDSGVAGVSDSLYMNEADLLGL